MSASQSQAGGSPAGENGTEVVVGRVASLRAYPVKSMDAVEVDAAQVLSTGLEHDRGWAVLAGDDVLTARTAPQLRDVRAAVPAPGGDGGPAVRLPGDDVDRRGEDADRRLSQALGREVHVRPAPTGAGAGFNEVAPVHLVSRQAVVRAAADEGTTPDDPACSVEQPRANVVLELDGDALETAWVGRELRLGEVVLRVSKQPKHCLGVYADVVRPGRVRVDDEVRLG